LLGVFPSEFIPCDLSFIRFPNGHFRRLRVVITGKGFDYVLKKRLQIGIMHIQWFAEKNLIP